MVDVELSLAWVDPIHRLKTLHECRIAQLDIFSDFRALLNFLTSALCAQALVKTDDMMRKIAIRDWCVQFSDNPLSRVVMVIAACFP